MREEKEEGLGFSISLQLLCFECRQRLFFGLLMKQAIRLLCERVMYNCVDPFKYVGGFAFNKGGTFFNKETTKDIPCVHYCGRFGTAVALYGEKVIFWLL